MYILSPYYNKFLNALSRKEHFNFILISLLIFSIISSLAKGQAFFGNELVQFLMFYSIGAYLKKYPKNCVTKYRGKILCFSIITLLITTLGFEILGTKILIFAKHSTYLFNRTSIIAIMLAVSLFSIFANRKPFSNKWINKIAGCMFGVYLIHDNKLIRNILWTDILKNKLYVNSNFMIIHLIISVSVVFVTCTVIEYMRIKLFSKINYNIFDKVKDKLSKIVNRFYVREEETN